MGPDDERDGLEKRREHAPGEHTDDASHGSSTTCGTPSAFRSADLASPPPRTRHPGGVSGPFPGSNRHARGGFEPEKRSRPRGSTGPFRPLRS
jgi:hypothetical protein